MNIRLHDGPLADLKCDAVFVPLDGGISLSRGTEELVARLRQSGEITGKRGELTILHEPSGLAASRLILMGVGSGLDANQAFFMAGQALRAAQKRKFNRIAFALSDGGLVRALSEDVGAWRAQMHATRRHKRRCEDEQESKTDENKVEAKVHARKRGIGGVHFPTSKKSMRKKKQANM